MHRFVFLIALFSLLSGVQAQQETFVPVSYVQLTTPATLMFQDFSSISSGFYVENQRLYASESHSLWMSGEQLLVLPEQLNPSRIVIPDRVLRQKFVSPGIGIVWMSKWSESAFVAATATSSEEIAQPLETGAAPQQYRFEFSAQISRFVQFVGLK